MEHITQTPPNNWEWLAVAQHHGLSTRLLDWTANPLVACFFAVVQQSTATAAVYAFRPIRNFNLDPDNLKPGSSPFKTVKTVAEFRPSAFSARISRQNARFTLHNPADADLYGSGDKYGEIEEIVIDPTYSDKLSSELDYYGYNYSTIFPDLDGLAEHLNWYAARRTAPAPITDDTKDH